MWRKPSWDVQIPLPNKYLVLLKAINGYRALCLRFIAFGYHVCIQMVLSLLQHLAVNSLSVFLFQLEEEWPLFSLGQESCWPTASFFPWLGKLLANCLFFPLARKFVGQLFYLDLLQIRPPQFEGFWFHKSSIEFGGSCIPCSNSLWRKNTVARHIPCSASLLEANQYLKIRLWSLIILHLQFVSVITSYLLALIDILA